MGHIGLKSVDGKSIVHFFICMTQYTHYDRTAIKQLTKLEKTNLTNGHTETGAFNIFCQRTGINFHSEVNQQHFNGSKITRFSKFSIN